MDAHRCAASRNHVCVKRHFIPDLYRLVEGHPLDRDGGRTAPRHPRGKIARRKVHLCHQPATKDVARRVGVGGHGDGTDDGLARGLIRGHGHKRMRAVGYPCCVPRSDHRQFRQQRPIMRPKRNMVKAVVSNHRPHVRTRPIQRRCTINDSVATFAKWIAWLQRGTLSTNHRATRVAGTYFGAGSINVGAQFDTAG